MRCTCQDLYPDLAAGIAAVLLFIHQNLDALDGKHARRTMNYSSMGELFGQVRAYAVKNQIVAQYAQVHILGRHAM